MSKPQAITLFEEGSEMYLKKHSSIIQINNITTLQQRKAINVFMWIAKQVLKKDPNQVLFRVDMATLKRISGIKDTNNSAIKKAMQSLTRTQVEYNILGKDEEVWGVFNILSEVSITTTKGDNVCFIEFGFPSKVLNAIKHPMMYAKLDLFVIRDLNSKYSVALYELLKDYQGLGERVFRVDDLRKVMGVDDKAYKVFTMFEKRVVKTAISEINQKTDLQIIYQTKKQGRVYVEIAFKVKLKDKEEIVGSLDNIDIQLQQFGFSNDEIKEIKSKHDENYILENIKIVESDYKKGKVKNLQAYIRASFEKDFRVKKTEYELQQDEQKQNKAKEEEEQRSKQEEEKKQKTLFEEERKRSIESMLEAKGEQYKKQLEKEFIESKKTNSILATIISRSGISSPMVYGQWLDFVEHKLIEGNQALDHNQKQNGEV